MTALSVEEQLDALPPEEAGAAAADLAKSAVAALPPFPKPALDDSWREPLLQQLPDLLRDLLADLSQSYEPTRRSDLTERAMDLLFEDSCESVTNYSEMEAAENGRRFVLVPVVLPFLRSCSSRPVEDAEVAILAYQAAGGSVELLVDTADNHKDELHGFLSALNTHTEPARLEWEAKQKKMAKEGRVPL